MTANIKKTMAFIIAAAMVCLAFAGIVVWNTQTDNALAADGETVITLQIDNPEMTVGDDTLAIDDSGTAPVIVDDRTLVPVRAIIEAVGGTVEWDADTRTVALTYGSDEIRLIIDSTTAYLNDEAQTLDVAPVIINDRTMLPIRFIAESLGFIVDWDGDEQIITITVPADEAAATDEPTETEDTTVTSEAELAVLNGLEHRTDVEDDPVVYFTSDISSDAMMEIYSYLGFEPEGNVAIKLSTGEAGNTHYLDPNLIKDLVQSVDGTIVECNTAYGGSRASTAVHMQTAEDHGFTAIADVDIMDADGSMSIPITGGENLTEDYVGAHLANYDSMITLSHFKGHAMGGFGGAIKNMSIGVASSEGKCWIHSAGNSMTSPWGGEQDSFLESMAEATSGVVDYFDGKVVYISVMNHLSVDCDCDSNPAEPEMHDVGILASTDPVALDQVCVDIVYNTDDSESGALQERIESRNGIHTLEHAEKIGLGSREYRLVDIDI